MNHILFFKKRTQSGFTLIETLFAVLIFSAALVSLMTIAGRGISATRTAREQVTAYYLAQEGLEVVRNIRDTNFVIDGLWDTGLSECVNDVCQVVYGDHTEPPTIDVCDTGCIVYSENGDFVDSDTNTIDSGFRRSITLEQTQSGEYLVKSRVSWNARNIPRSVELSTVLKKWR